MDFDKAIDEVAANYSNRGYDVIVRPQPKQLPDFAKDFRIQVVCRMRDTGVLVAVKRNREDFASDPEMDRYAEVTSAQNGWRFDFVLLEDSGGNREIEGAQELSEDEFDVRRESVDRLMQEHESALAYIAAWATLESAIRRLLRANGRLAGWGTPPLEMINELVSSGLISIEDHMRLYRASRLRNEIVHGFAVRTIDDSEISFLLELTTRLLVATKEASMHQDCV